MTDDEPEDTGSTLPRRQLGRLLREAREATGMSLEEAARLMEWGKSTLSRLERGKSERVRVREVSGLCELYGTDDEKTAAIKELAGQAPVRSWWRGYSDVIAAKFKPYIGLEAGASELAIFQPLIVPGLLQTADYARTLDKQYFPNDSDEELERRVALRIQRQHIATRRRQPVRLVVVLHEAVLRTVVGGPRVMAAVCRHIADLSTRENIEVRILPFRAGFPTGIVVSPFIIMTFPKDSRGKPVEPTIVFAESFTGDVYLESSDDVRRCRETFRSLLRATIDVRPSRDLLREIAREYESER
ncbi:helix-turn-helix domain-containing protein [Nocardia donostiensis]|uniref:Transcriptional regulator n=1 Tax=Nocardia donostiensis TaxID=1538463 RepID=A0A1W0B8C3_9NOCA|nr:helix-turn-helix transcriptional regulator [Nocardia donostiensis]ONM50743.1 transcriptional regulator [Nocardia donostiensis]OQS17462.1 transcriptional regulator [Nocardia donostiensis]OQS18757.1 transcriptional regulator [Nocardia donostiensis]